MVAPIYLGMMAFICFVAWQSSNSRRQFEAQNEADYARMVHNDPDRIRQHTDFLIGIFRALRANRGE